jgi:hypothetical protein
MVKTPFCAFSDPALLSLQLGSKLVAQMISRSSEGINGFEIRREIVKEWAGLF